MDIKLKKSHKLTTFIIMLCIIVPALVLVSLYPTMEQAMQKKKAEYKKLDEQLEKQNAGEEYALEVEDTFINYAMEASYYAYGNMSQSDQEGKESVDYSVLKHYGWVSDYYRVYENTSIDAIYKPDGEDSVTMDTKMPSGEEIATLTFHFDAYGNLEIETQRLDICYTREYNSIYETAMQSERQYQNNVKTYNKEHNTNISDEQLKPKDFVITFYLTGDSNFVRTVYEYEGFYDSIASNAENIYFEIGAYWVVLALVIFVVIMALVLPFVKSLNTGYEKIFSWPFEVMCVIGTGTVFAGIWLCIIMANVTKADMEMVFASQLPEFLGKEISINLLYQLFLGVSLVAWAILFFLIYMVTSNLRQIFANTKYYLKNQVVCVRIVRWMGRKCKQFYNYVTDIRIDNKINSSIVKIVLVNFAILALICCTWFFGLIGLVAYSVALYLILRRESEKVQMQYDSVLNATKQMADGDLKISLEEDLGIFAPIGESLCEVQQGFEKAVIEEAKSQSMKTELITNVSHDLKTPLTAIITYVDLLKNDNLTEEERKSYIATLDSKSQRLKVLIEDLFEVSKAQSGNVKMNFMDVDVVGLLKQVRSEMNEQIINSNLQFRWNLPEEKVLLSLDGQRTYRVFENLLNNILKYAMPNSRVYIDVNETNAGVQIQFRNISAMELDFDAQRLTERFVRGDSSRNSEGSGLGLAIAKSFVELQNGEFSVEVDGDLFKAIIVFHK